MKLIVSDNTLIQKIIGVQTLTNNISYRLATYICIVKYKEDFLLYNDLSKNLYLISKEENECLSKPLINIPENLLPLLNDRSLVPTDFDDLNFVNQIKNIYNQFISSAKKQVFIIFTTTKCNARCYYCFEHGQRRIDMSEKTAQDVADYIIKNLETDKVYLKWFGGEPLYNEPVIDIICNRLNSAGIEYVSQMTTNGYLFTDDTIQNAINFWKLHDVVITIDGTEQVYNKTKNYIYGTGNPFRIVMSNIKKLLENKIYVTIRFNIGYDNISDIKSLLLYIKDYFGKNEYLSIVAVGLYDLEKTRSETEKMKLSNNVELIENKIAEFGYRKFSLKKYRNLGSTCMAESDDSAVISPLGLLGKCEHFSEGEMMYGSIYSDEVNLDAKNHFKNRIIVENCKSCPLYPSCGGATKCPTHYRDCKTYEKDKLVRALKKSMIYTYKQTLNEKGKG